MRPNTDLLLISLSLAAVSLHAQGPVVCDRQDLDSIPQISLGLSELVTIPPLVCRGGTPGQEAVIELSLFVSAPITNPVIGPGETTNAVIVIDNPEPGTERLGINVVTMNRNPQFDRDRSARFTYMVKPNGEPTILTPANFRIDTTDLPDSDGPVFTGGIINGTTFLPDAEIAVRPFALPGLIEVESPTSAGTLVVITEAYPGSLRPRTLNGDRPQTDINNSLLFGGSQSQYVPAGEDGMADPRFQASSGNRFLFQVEGLPDGVTPLINPVAVGAQDPRRGFRAVMGADELLVGGTPVVWFMDDLVPFEPGPDGAFRMLSEAGWVDDVAPTDPIPETPNSYGWVLGWGCEAGEELERLEARLSVYHAPLSSTMFQLSEEGRNQAVPLPGPAYDPNLGAQHGITFDPADCVAPPAPRPMVSEGGVANGASFGGDGLAPGSIVSVFGTGLGPMGQAGAVPLPTEFGGSGSTDTVIVEIDGMPAPLLFSSAPQINLQIPFEASPPPSGQLVEEGAKNQASTATLVVRRGDQASDPVEIALAAANPGIFTIGGGAGGAIAINPDSSLALPIGSVSGLATRPAVIGEGLVILATGLGATSPPGITGDDSFDENGAFVQRDTVLVPRVLIGGVEAQLFFSGLSPQFVGVNQINAAPAPGTPTGDAQSLVIEIGGVRSRDDVTIAVAAP